MADIVDDGLDEATGPLMYTYDRGTEIYYLDNAIACMYAAHKGIPACSRDWTDIYTKALAAGEPDTNYDESDEGSTPFLLAAIEVLNTLETRK